MTARRVQSFRGPSLPKYISAERIGPRKHVRARRTRLPLMTQLHRKTVRSCNLPGRAHELTFSCFRRLLLLNRDRTRLWFLDACEPTRRRRNVALWTYVAMPEHVHLIVYPRDPVYEVRLIRTALKVPVQRKGGLMKTPARFHPILIAPSVSPLPCTRG